MSLSMRWGRGLLASAAAVLLLVGASSVGLAGGKKDDAAVGGVYVDAEGVLSLATEEQSGELREERLRVLQQIPGGLEGHTNLRMVSLRRLAEAIAEQHRKIAPLTEEMQFLAGLQRIQYVFVYPEENDIVLAGPGEGWRVDERGFMVGVTTGRPVVTLDDLLVALWTAEDAAQGKLTCSIDPNPEGIQRLNAFVKTQKQIGPDTIRGIEQALGPQAITIQGARADTHFARVMVAADYRMKRLAMAFDAPPVPDMPNYLQLVSARATNIMPRWWLTTNYDALLKDADGLAWELRGQGVKVLTEDEIVSETGERQRTGQANSAAQKWADTMTEKYDELSLRDPIFGQLRNLFDLAVVAALIHKENLCERAGCPLEILMNEDRVGVESRTAPTKVPSRASALKKGRGWVISASGGVEVNSWQAAERVETDENVSTVRDQAAPEQPAGWWWNG